MIFFILFAMHIYKSYSKKFHFSGGKNEQTKNKYGAVFLTFEFQCI